MDNDVASLWIWTIEKWPKKRFFQITPEPLKIEKRSENMKKSNKNDKHLGVEILKIHPLVREL